MPKMLRLAATIWKCPDFLLKMSGILDTRIPTCCNSDGAHNWSTGSEPRFFVIPSTFAKKVFDLRSCSMKKGCDR